MPLSASISRAILDPSAFVLGAKERERSQVLKFKIPHGISSISDNAPAIPEHNICDCGHFNRTVKLDDNAISRSVCFGNERASRHKRELIVINISYANYIYIYNACRKK